MNPSAKAIGATQSNAALTITLRAASQPLTASSLSAPTSCTTLWSCCQGRFAKDDPLEKIREYGHVKRGYGHDIVRLWQEFKTRQLAPVAAEFDAIIEGLNAFEDIRYPETLIREGATISIGIFEVDDPIGSNGQIPEKLYVLHAPSDRSADGVAICRIRS